MWHIYQILNCCEKPRTQMEITKESELNNFTLKKYLKKLVILEFIEKVGRDHQDAKKHNVKAIMWQVTDKGRIFKKIISQYVGLGFELK